MVIDAEPVVWKMQLDPTQAKRDTVANKILKGEYPCGVMLCTGMLKYALFSLSTSLPHPGMAGAFAAGAAAGVCDCFAAVYIDLRHEYALRMERQQLLFFPWRT